MGEMCLKAVESNGDALRYVKEQSEAVCLKAVESDGDALQYVKEQMFERIIVIDGSEVILSEQSYQALKAEFTK